jgi:hypothetical protein
VKRSRLIAGLVLSVVGLPQVAGAQTGEFRVQGGTFWGSSGGSSVQVVTTASFAFVKSNFSFGPEALYVFGSPRVLGIGAVARLRIGSSRLAPFLVGSLGGDYWKNRRDLITAGLFTGSLGAGLELSGTRGPSVTLEARGHKRLQNYSGGGDWDFLTITAGVRFQW